MIAQFIVSRFTRVTGLFRNFLLTALLPTAASAQTDTLPQGFVYVETVIPDAIFEIRYQGADNFIGRRITGYERPVAILSKPAAQALAKVADELRQQGYKLKIFDAYRPQRAVDDFVRWAADPEDRRMQARYYPGIDKAKLIPKGYIALHSGHSRGSTVDLTLVTTSADGPVELDMGTRWDHFGPESAPNSDAVTPRQRANRELLRTAMLDNGFVPIAEEWWHFTLRDEPHPDTYFDFPVR